MNRVIKAVLWSWFIVILSSIIYSAYAETCPQTQVYNISEQVWLPFDTKVMEHSKKVCKEKYPQSPCLVKFVKIEPRTYEALCGN